MDVLYFPTIWHEEQRFSPPTSLESTGSPNLPDEVIAILAEEPKFKQMMEKVSNPIKSLSRFAQRQQRQVSDDALKASWLIFANTI